MFRSALPAATFAVTAFAAPARLRLPALTSTVAPSTSALTSRLPASTLRSAVRLCSHRDCGISKAAFSAGFPKNQIWGNQLLSGSCQTRTVPPSASMCHRSVTFFWVSTKLSEGPQATARSPLSTSTSKFVMPSAATDTGS